MRKKIIIIVLITFCFFFAKELADFFKFKQEFNKVNDIGFLYKARHDLINSYKNNGCFNLLDKEYCRTLSRARNYHIKGLVENNTLKFYLIKSISERGNFFIDFFLKNKINTDDTTLLYEISSLEFDRSIYTEHVIISDSNINKTDVIKDLSFIIDSLGRIFEDNHIGYYISSFNEVDNIKSILTLRRDNISGIVSYNINKKLDFIGELYVLELKFIISKIMQEKRISFIQVPVLFPEKSILPPPDKIKDIEKLKEDLKKLIKDSLPASPEL